MILFISLGTLLLAYLLLRLDAGKKAVTWAVGVLAAAGIIASGVLYAITPVTSTTSTYTLRPLAIAGAPGPGYLATAAGSTSYAYDDNGATRPGSTTSKQSVEIRQDGGSEPRVEITRTRNNNLFVITTTEVTESFVFHIPAGSGVAAAKG